MGTRYDGETAARKRHRWRCSMLRPRVAFGGKNEIVVGPASGVLLPRNSTSTSAELSLVLEVSMSSEDTV